MERVIPKAAAPAVTLYLTLDCSLESVCQKLSIWKKRNNKERPKLVRLSRGLLDQIYSVTVHQSLTAPRLINYLFYWLSVSVVGVHSKFISLKLVASCPMLKYKFDVKKRQQQRANAVFAIWHGNLDFVPETGQVENERGRKKKKRTRLV